MLHVINARCVPRDLRTTAPWPFERICSQRSEEIAKKIELRLLMLIIINSSSSSGGGGGE